MTPLNEPNSKQIADDLYDFLQPVSGGRNGDIPTIGVGKLQRMPVRALEQKLDATMKPEAA